MCMGHREARDATHSRCSCCSSEFTGQGEESNTAELEWFPGRSAVQVVSLDVAPLQLAHKHKQGPPAHGAL